MTQVEYDIIVQCIKSGVPALSDKLILSLNNLVLSSSADNQNKPIEEENKTENVAKKNKKKGEINE